MIKQTWNSDVSIVVGLAIVVLSAKLSAGAILHVPNWIPGPFQRSAEEGARRTGESQAPEPVVVEVAESAAPPAPIIVLPSTKERAGCRW